MKITDLKTFIVDCYRTNWVFVKLYTDEGLTGVGEATLEYKEHALAGAIEDLKRYLLGKNPLEIEKHSYEMYRSSYWRTGPVLMSAISGVEIAMWDITGKYYNTPVHKLLGGSVRDRIPIYANGWFAGAKTPDEFARKAKLTAAKGIRAIKWDPFGKAYLSMTEEELDGAIECVAAVREAVGNKMELLIEGHGRFNVSTAIRIARRLEPFRVKFFEEPLPPDSIDSLAEVRANSPVPIAAGERIYTRYSMRELLEKRAVDFIQPDVSHAGGILELKKIAAMAEAYYIPFMPHNPSGPVANAASLQLAGCTPNFEMLEIMITDMDFRPSITNESVDYEDGCLLIPTKPGLGIELNEQAAAEHPYTPKDLRHYRGDLTDIRPPNGGTCYYFKGIDRQLDA